VASSAFGSAAESGFGWRLSQLGVFPKPPEAQLELRVLSTGAVSINPNCFR
jgi:hypothetical protein